jgi:hypothetical protein
VTSSTPGGTAAPNDVSCDDGDGGEADDGCGGGATTVGSPAGKRSKSCARVVEHSPVLADPAVLDSGDGGSGDFTVTCPLVENSLVCADPASTNTAATATPAAPKPKKRRVSRELASLNQWSLYSPRKHETPKPAFPAHSPRAPRSAANVEVANATHLIKHPKEPAPVIKSIKPLVSVKSEYIGADGGINTTKLLHALSAADDAGRIDALHQISRAIDKGTVCSHNTLFSCVIVCGHYDAKVVLCACVLRGCALLLSVQTRERRQRHSPSQVCSRR